ncbi:MAG: ComEC/Rec2 family competence protein [Anaerolineae bacterium]|nr:ComEC/Rec2 family competence protein [Anaerolineae bacterium]
MVPNARVTVAGNAGQSVLFDLRVRAEDTIDGALPEPSSSLLSGILLGVESGIAPDLRDDFNAVGATHVIAISGFNMTVLAMVISRVTRQLIPSRRAAAVAGIAGIALYTAFVGADPGWCARPS